MDDIGRRYANLSSTLLICGQAEESQAVALEGVGWARSVGASSGYGRFIAGNAVDAAVRVGRWDQAEDLAGRPRWRSRRREPDRDDHRARAAVYAGSVTRRKRSACSTRARAGRPLQEAQFTGPMYVGIVELELTTGSIDEAAARRRTAST